MNIFWIVVALVGYFVVKDKINKHIKEIQKWIKENKDKIEEWGKISAIKRAYDSLVTKINAAQLDKKWTVWEIIGVLIAASNLINLVKEYEEGKNG